MAEEATALYANVEIGALTAPQLLCVNMEKSAYPRVAAVAFIASYATVESFPLRTEAPAQTKIDSKEAYVSPNGRMVGCATAYCVAFGLKSLHPSSW